MKVRPAHISATHCPGRFLGILGHAWQTRKWDKFGTGKQTESYEACRYCIAFRGLE